MPGDILSAVEAGTQFASVLMNEKIKMNNELTEADYKDQSYKFNDAFQSLMLDFENRPDYENFQSEYDDFFTEQKDLINANAKTGRSAKMLSEMVDNTYQQYKYRLEQSVINSQRAAVRSLHAEDIQRTKNDTLMSTEDKVSNILQVNNDDYRNGNFASAQEYEQKTLSDITDVVLNDSKNIGMNVLAAGGSLEEAVNAAYAGVDKDFSISMLEAGTLKDADRSGSLNREGIKTQLRKELNTYWTTVITETQKTNEGTLSQVYASLLQLSGSDLLNGVTKAFETLNGMTGNALKAEDRDKYARYFKSLMDSVETGDGTTKAGNSAVKTAVFTGLLTDNNMYPFFEAAARGEYPDMYCMKEAFETADYNYTAAQYKEIYGKELTREEYYTAKSKELGEVMQKCIKSGLLPPQAQVLVTKTKNMLNTMFERQFGMSAEKYFEGQGEYFDLILQQAEELAADLVFQCNLGDQEQLDQLIPQFENRINAMFLNGLDFSMERKWNENQDKVIARTVDALSNEASAVTLGEDPGHAHTVYAPGAEDAKNNVAASLKDRIADMTGIPAEELTVKDDLTEHDMTANPILSDTKGNHYKYESKDGKLSVMVKHGNGEWEELKKPEETPKADRWEGVIDSQRNAIERKVKSGAVPKVVPDRSSPYKDRLTQMNVQKWNLLTYDEKCDLLAEMARSAESVIQNKLKEYINQ